MKHNKIMNPMELYSEKTGKHINDEFRTIINHDLLTDDEKIQRLYELFVNYIVIGLIVKY